MVESVQRDRSRLQDECNNLEHQLLLSREEILKLKETIEEIHSQMNNNNNNTNTNNSHNNEENLQNKSIIIPINLHHPPTASVNETSSIENSPNDNITLQGHINNNNNQTVGSFASSSSAPSASSSTNIQSPITSTSFSLDQSNNSNDISLHFLDNTPELTIDGNTPDENNRFESQTNSQPQQNIHHSVSSSSPLPEILKSSSIDSNNNGDVNSIALPPPLPPSSPRFHDNLPPVPQSPSGPIISQISTSTLKYSTPQSSSYHPNNKPYTPRSSIISNEQFTSGESQSYNSLYQQIKELTFELNKTKEEVCNYSYFIILFSYLFYFVTMR